MPFDASKYFGRRQFHSYQIRKNLKNSFDVYKAKISTDISIELLGSNAIIIGFIEGQYLDGNYCPQQKETGSVSKNNNDNVSSQITDNSHVISDNTVAVSNNHVAVSNKHVGLGSDIVEDLHDEDKYKDQRKRMRIKTERR